MTCYHPIDAWRSLYPNKNGKRKIVFDTKEALPFSHLQVPCGKCIGCRLDRSAQSAVRGYHELLTCGQENCCFITLTYDNENLPFNKSVSTSDLQKFWKRLRKRFPNARFKYIACSEYGALRSRPHYHACIFGFRFPDERLPSPPVAPRSHSGFPNFQSDCLNQLWPYGIHVINNVSFNSVAYVARYILKKTLGDGSKYYVDEDGVCIEKERSYWSAGIGLNYFNRYWKDFYSLNGCQVKKIDKEGNEVIKTYPVPRYYDKKLEVMNPSLFNDIKLKRSKEARKLKNIPKYQPAGLAMSEMCRIIRVDKFLSRPLEA